MSEAETTGITLSNPAFDFGIGTFDFAIGAFDFGIGAFDFAIGAFDFAQTPTLNFYTSGG